MSSDPTPAAPEATTPPKPWWRGWLEALAAYKHPRVLAMLFLGFSAGLPFMLVFSTLSAWLREVGVERATIGMLSWVGIIYSIKFFWAPVVDRLPLPLLGRWLGRRRSWMLLAQAGIALGLFNIAHLDPVGHLALKYSHPKWMVARWSDWLDEDEVAAVCASGNRTPHVVARVTAGAVRGVTSGTRTLDPSGT